MPKNPPPPTCSKCNKPMRFMLVKMGGRKFRCIDCDVPGPLQLQEVKKILTGELRPPEEGDQPQRDPCGALELRMRKMARLNAPTHGDAALMILQLCCTGSLAGWG